MPDWSYQTIFRPCFFRMPPRTAQRFAFGCLGWLGSGPLGRAFIRFMGHMQPAECLGFSHHRLRFDSRVGLCAGVDSLGEAMEALDTFGLAFLEYGPLTIEPQPSSEVRFWGERATIELELPEQNPGLGFVIQKKLSRVKTPLFIRFDPTLSADDIAGVLPTAAMHSPPKIAGYVIPASAARGLVRDKRIAKRSQRRYHLLVLVGASDCVVAEQYQDYESFDGVLIDGALTADGSRVFCPQAIDATARATQRWREALGDEAVVIASGGVVEPRDVLRLYDAGADIVGVDFGVVFAGPGLIKRSNELLAQTRFRDPEASITQQSIVRESWFWSLLMGLAMLGGGLLALIIGLTRVVLPYDESAIGMTREQLMLVNDRLIAFMSHDRVTLAGTMLAVGTLYSALSWFGARRGAHWAQQAIVWSALVGFFTFFLFLGFGYFDAFHAFVTTILFQLLLLTIYAKLPAASGPIRVDPRNDFFWKRALWGQLMFLILGATLITAGTIICKIGITSVFVPEDIEFLCTTPDRLLEVNPQVISLVAHDRATFGGMLIASGITVLLSALWGFRRGHSWLWWTLVVAGGLGFVCTIAIHHQVGYTSFKHLLPAYGGLIWLAASAALCHKYLHHHVERCE